MVSIGLVYDTVEDSNTQTPSDSSSLALGIEMIR